MPDGWLGDRLDLVLCVASRSPSDISGGRVMPYVSLKGGPFHNVIAKIPNRSLVDRMTHPQTGAVYVRTDQRDGKHQVWEFSPALSSQESE